MLIKLSCDSQELFGTTMANRVNEIYEFGPFRLDTKEKQFLKGKEQIVLSPKAFEMLVALLERSGHLVEKEELLKQLWPDSFVEEANLSHNIYLIRRALGQHSEEQQYIETVPRHGYRFVADVKKIEVLENRPPVVAQEHTRTHIVVEEDEDGSPPHVSEQSSDLKNHARQAARHSAFSRKQLMVCIVAIFSLASYLFWRARAPQPAAPHPKIKSIAVLPFKSLRTGDDEDVLGLGLADSMIIKLSSLHDVTVLPTSSVFRYVGHQYDPLAAGRELNVDAVLNGTVQHEEGRVRVTAQLVSVADGKTVWASKFDGKFTSSLDLQDSISSQAAVSLIPSIAGADPRLLAKRFTNNSQAYDLYLMGIYFWNKRTEQGLAKAVDYFNQAIEKDHDYALAYAALADCYYLIGYYNYQTVPVEEAKEKAERAANKALALDELLPEGHLAMAAVKLDAGDMEAASQEYRKAIALNPSYATAHQRYAWLFLGSGQRDEALRHMRKALELDPLSAPINVSLSQLLIVSGELDEGIRYSHRAIEINPEFVNPYFLLINAYIQKGMYEEAAQALRKVQELSRSKGLGLEGSGMIYAASGRREEARKVLVALQPLADHGEADPYDVGVIYALLRQNNQAFEWLEKALKAKGGFYNRVLLKYSRLLDNLRNDPRFEELSNRYPLTPEITVPSP